MENDKISVKQMIAAIALHLCGSSIVFTGTSTAKQDTWFCAIIGFLLSIPMLLAYCGILNLSGEMDFFSGILKICGRIPGKILCVLYALLTLQIGGLVARIFLEFIHNLNLTETPFIAILVFLLGTVIYVMRNNLHVLTRIAKFLLFFYIFSVAATVFLSVPIMHFSNLKPFLHSGLGAISRSSFSEFSLPFSEILFCLPMLSELKTGMKPFPVLFRGSLTAFLLLLTIALRNIMILGYSAGAYEFPSYQAASIIAVGEFFTRIEILVGLYIVSSGFVKLCVLLYTSCRAWNAVFEFKNYRRLTAPCALLIMTCAMLIPSSSEELFSWIEIYPYYAFPFQILIPLLLLIIAAIQKKLRERKKRGGKSPQSAGEAKKGQPVPDKL